MVNIAVFLYHVGGNGDRDGDHQRSKAMGMDKKTGPLEPGTYADVIIIDTFNV